MHETTRRGRQALLRRLGPSCLLTAFAAACGQAGPARPSPSPVPTSAAALDAPQDPGEAEGSEPAPEATPLPPGLAPITEPFTGDLDGMLQRRIVRVLTVQSPINYFVDRGRELGLVYETARALEQELNGAKSKVVRVHVVLLPVARDELIPRLLKGEGDIAAAQLTITPERQKQVDFSQPFAEGVSEVLVTGPSATPVAGLQDLAGREVYVRASSSYAEHLAALNRRFAAEGRAPVQVVAADETLEDGDILEMVNAGLLPATVVDSFVADFYAQVFPSLSVHEDVAVNTGGRIAWAFRKGSPGLAAAVNRFARTHRQGSGSGNVLIQRYLKSTKWVKNARSEEDMRRFRSMIELFQRYAQQYSFDWLLMAAQGYQESGLDQQKRSRVGAIGVMQVMPTTARDKAIGIPDIEKLESNIHAGIKYNRWVVDNFFDDPGLRPLDRQLFAFASYNAGPGRVSRLRKEAAASGLDPDRWFNNVELVAARRIGRETVQYVANIYKYYLAYQLVLQQHGARQEAKREAGTG